MGPSVGAILHHHMRGFFPWCWDILIIARSPKKAKVKPWGQIVYPPGVKPDRINLTQGKYDTDLSLISALLPAGLTATWLSGRAKGKGLGYSRFSAALTPPHLDS